MNRLSRLLPLVLLLTLPAGCSSGGGGSATIAGLSAPAELTLVEPEGGASPDLPPSAPDFAPSSAYVTDSTSVSVYDPALEPLQTINNILCYIHMTGAGLMVNQGVYSAQIDDDICEDSGGGGDASTSSGETPSFSIWTVESSRASNSSAQTFQVWVPDDEDSFMDSQIFVDGEVTVGATPSNPYGNFHLNFAGFPASGGSISSPYFFGALSTLNAPGQVGFQHYEDNGDISLAHSPGDFSRRTQVVVEIDPVGDTGLARILESRRENNGGGDTGILTNEYAVAYDATHFLRGVNGAPGTAYERASFNEHVYRYGLYHATGSNAGQRVERNSGFGVKDGSGNYGWVGYNGLWTPEGVTWAHGDTVERDIYGSTGMPDAYTVFRAPGRLIRNSRQQVNLAEIDGEDFQWPDWTGSATVLYLVRYDNTGGVWERHGTIDAQTGIVTPITPVTINTSTEGSLGMWSETLGGQASYVHGDGFISYFERSFVDGADSVFTSSSSLTLYGTVQCMASAITTMEAESGDIFMPTAMNVGSAYAFEFTESDLTLRWDSDGMGTMLQVGLASGQAVASGPYVWGMQSGPMVTSMVGITDVNDVWSADTFYVWETGPNDWNQYAGIKDAMGEFVPFEPPLRIQYTHATANDRNASTTHDGRVLLLEYSGFGDLHGIPFEALDLDGDMNPDRYYPEFSLVDGTLLGGSSEYILKATEVEQVLVEDLGGTSLSLAGASALTLPTASSYTEPTNGARPTVTDAPRVINGEVVN